VEDGGREARKEQCVGGSQQQFSGFSVELLRKPLTCDSPSSGSISVGCKQFEVFGPEVGFKDCETSWEYV
jgi:hypothetical protein